MFFSSKRPHFHHLKKKWTLRHKKIQNQLWNNHSDAFNWLSKSFPSRQFVVGSLGGLMLLSSPAPLSVPQSHQVVLASNVNGDSVISKLDKNRVMASNLQQKLPSEMRALTPEEESDVSQLLTENFGFKVTPELDNIRLNRSYGLIGGEQHLYRYPGDTLEQHADTSADWAMYGSSGIAPGLGAWGYFAPSKAEFSELDKQRERYYIAVQTFLAPGFAENVGKYRDFFKFRKMLVLNPKTGQAVVTVVGDAGPAQWTGKHLGGSPEVMHHVGLATGPRKGAVIYMFIDDPEDKISLGPIEVKN